MAPALVYREAELPLRVVRDLFTGQFERLAVDHERTYRRIVSYLKRSSPDLARKVEWYREPEPLMARFGVDAAVRSTLARRVDLPSGGYLVFDYAEAFTVIDVNTGRFVGTRGKGSAGRLEDTITKNNLEAAKEIVRQLRLRDIGGIIVIDFIDMANPKNRAEVEEALKRELERDRTKTYVVEISPLGLVEMTRQNVTDGPREIITTRCPTCEGDGVVVSEETYAVDAEAALRRLAAGSSAEALLVELPSSVAGILIGPAGARLAEIEKETGKRLAFETRDDLPPDHFAVLAEGRAADLELRALPVAPGDVLEVALESAHLTEPRDAVGRLDGYVVSVAEAADRIGETARVRVERVTRTVAYAVLAEAAEAELPVEPGALAEASEAEESATRAKRSRGTRGGRARKKPAAAEAAKEVGELPRGAEKRAPARRPRRTAPEREEAPAGEAGSAKPAEGGEQAEGEKPKRKTRRGTRGGRGRKKAEAAPEAAAAEPAAAPGTDETGSAVQEAEEAPPAPRRRTRRGSRGGGGRRKATASGGSATPSETQAV